MYKHEITYTDFDGDERTDTLYFHLTKTDMVELQVEHKEGLDAFLQRMIDEKDAKHVLKEIQRLMVTAYGERSEDGKHFFKDEEMGRKFRSSAAYDTLFMEFLENQDVFIEFVMNIIPKDMRPDPQEVERIRTAENMAEALGTNKSAATLPNPSES